VASRVGPSSYFDVARIDALEPATRELVRRRVDVLGPAYRLFYEQPVQIMRGEGVHLYDADGTEYLDCYNNVASLGHAHPRVTAAIAEQAAVLNTHTRWGTSCSPAPGPRPAISRCASRSGTPVAPASS